MKILCITHADFETPGIITDWAVGHDYGLTVVKPYRGEVLPNMNDFNCLIVMGGPQSAVTLEDYPYLHLEVDTVRAALVQDKPVIGFCLGAQLIGVALGTKAERSPEKEVGVYPITLTQAGMDDTLFKGMPQSFPVIHWHNDMPGLTNDAVILASSIGCPRQVVKYKPNVYGFQCHMEITAEGIDAMILAVPEDLAPSRFTQSSDLLRAQDYVAINRDMFGILDRFIAL